MKNIIILLLLTSVYSSCTKVTKCDMGDTPKNTSADYYVTLQGNDNSGNGSEEHPFATIEKALSVIPADKGMTLHIGEGRFVVNKQLKIPSGVNIIGAGFGKTAISCENYFDIETTKATGFDWQNDPVYDPKARQTATFVFTGKDQEVSGIEFDGNSKKTIAPILILNGTNIVFESIYCHDFKISGWWLHEGKDVTLSNSKFINNSWGNKNQDFGSVIFYRVDNFFLHDNYIDETASKTCGVKMTSVNLKNMWPDEVVDAGWLNGTVNKNVNIFNNIVKVNETSNWGVPSSDAKIPAITIEMGVGLECEAKVYNNTLNNTMSIVSHEMNAKSKYEVYNNIADLRYDNDYNSNKYSYFVEATDNNIDIHHNLVIRGYYPLSNWAVEKHRNCQIHHNIFFAPYGREDLAFFLYEGGYNGYKFYNNTVIDIFNKGKIFVVKNTGTATENAEFKNNIFWAAGNWGDSMGGPDAVSGAISNNAFYNITPRGTDSYLFDPLLKLEGPVNDMDFYTLKAGSPAIDKGVVIPGITDDYAGAAPDLGALEYGKEPFTVGVQNYQGPQQ